MTPLNVVVAQADSQRAEALAASLHAHFRSVSVARSLEELRDAIPKNRAEVAIVDLELVSLPEVQELHREFTGTCIVCTHRLGDEEMWTSALSAGASDFCSNADARDVVLAALRAVSSQNRSSAA